ncbi:MAG TPA: VOC family protein [Acidobacteriaceae bacterium]|jgi:PhnB protein|nr:VOC family protein [Acidobacteriaceae bacterium]
MNLYTHLNFGGNCHDAFQFYAQHLGGTISMMMTQADMPAGNRAPGVDPGAVAHARMHIGNTELIGNDVPADRFQPMRSVYLYLAVDSPQEAERIYAVLTEQGDVYMPLAETFYASRFGMLRDRFGVSWTLICEQPR